LLAALEDAMSHGARHREDRDSGQGSLFGGDEDDAPAAASRQRIVQVPEWSDKQRLEEEKKVLGFYFSGHPLSEARELVEALRSCEIKSLGEIQEGHEVLVAGYVTAIRNTVTRAKNEKMAVLTVEDFSGSTQVVCFPRTYDKFKELIQPDRILFFRGRLKQDNGGGNGGGAPKAEDGEAPAVQVSLAADEVLEPDQAALRHVTDVSFTFDNDDLPAPDEKASLGLSAKIEAVLSILQRYPGKTQVYFMLTLDNLEGASADVRIKGGERFRINPTNELFQSLRSLMRRGSVRITSEGTKARAAAPSWRNRERAAAPQGV
jgi:DNA polymerase III alpha subunit